MPDASADLEVLTEGEDLDGASCEEASADIYTLEPEEIEALDAALASGDDDEVASALEKLYGPAEFFRPGGGWGGSEAPARRAERIGHRNGLVTTSTKQQRPQNPGSDHDVDNRNAFAVDLSNGSSPTPQMDRTARQIAAAAGRPRYTRGFLEVRYAPHRMRMQLIWRYPGHYNHVHAGFRRT